MNPFLRTLILATGAVIIFFVFLMSNVSYLEGPFKSAWWGFPWLTTTICLCVVCYQMAAKRGRDKWMWAVWRGGVWGGFLGLILLYHGLYGMIGYIAFILLLDGKYNKDEAANTD